MLCKNTDVNSHYEGIGRKGEVRLREFPCVLVFLGFITVETEVGLSALSTAMAIDIGGDLSPV